MDDLNSLFSFKIINECKLYKSSLIENDESMKKADSMSLNLPLVAFQHVVYVQKNIYI